MASAKIVADTRRRCLMNMFLHSISEIKDDASIPSNDFLTAESGSASTVSLRNRYSARMA